MERNFVLPLVKRNAGRHARFLASFSNVCSVIRDDRDRDVTIEMSVYLSVYLRATSYDVVEGASVNSRTPVASSSLRDGAAYRFLPAT